MFWNARKWQITMHCPLKTRYNARTKGALDKINSAENGYDSMGFMQRGRDLWWMCTHITRFRCVVSADCCLSSLARPLSFCPLRLLLSTKVVRVWTLFLSRAVAATASSSRFLSHIPFILKKKKKKENHQKMLQACMGWSTEPREIPFVRYGSPCNNAVKHTSMPYTHLM